MMRRGGILRLAALVAVGLVLAGCSERREKQVAFDGVYFKTKSSAVDKKVTLADFTVTVAGVSQSLDGAREAGGYEGIKYCIANYGTSQIEWAVGPETAPENLAIVDDDLIFQGRCDP